MTAHELAHLLLEMPDVEVRIAYQENYPLRGRVANVVTDRTLKYNALMAEDVPEDADMSLEEELDERDEEKVWIAVSNIDSWSENPYGPSAAWTTLEEDRVR